MLVLRGIMVSEAGTRESARAAAMAPTCLDDYRVGAHDDLDVLVVPFA